MLDFATKLRIIRTMLNLRQEGFAERLGVRREAVSRWETGDREPNKRKQRMIEILAEREGLIFNERGYPEYAGKE